MVITANQLTSPHGSDVLKPLLINGDERLSELDRARGLLSIPLTTRETSDVLMFGMGAYTPLDGFMGQKDWQGVCSEMKLESGLFWPIPVTVSVSQEIADTIDPGQDIALCDSENGEILAILNVSEKYSIEKQLECKTVYKTTDENHPGVQKVMTQQPVNLGGSLKVLSEGEISKQFPELYLTPAQSRAAFTDKGWSKVAAFQTRNPMHRSHEYLTKIAIEITDGVFIHQVLGALKPGDIPADVRTRAIQAMIDNYFVPGTVIQAGYPIEMRYAGPREALFHALIRQNFGCSHLIVGRDHAGVGDYYGPFDAHKIFDEIPADSLQTQPLKIDITFFCKKCDGMATAKTCPHGKEDQVSISGTQQREMLSTGVDIPKEFSRPEVVAVLRDYYNGL
ncbi:MAG: sulfate adenylyltransferase [Hyphomicrobiales bacterium]|nr:sulfate adenylyltransferase [Hyphomicrobiales bacterium]